MARIMWKCLHSLLGSLTLSVSWESSWADNENTYAQLHVFSACGLAGAVSQPSNKIPRARVQRETGRCCVPLYELASKITLRSKPITCKNSFNPLKNRQCESDVGWGCSYLRALLGLDIPAGCLTWLATVLAFISDHRQFVVCSTHRWLSKHSCCGSFVITEERPCKKLHKPFHLWVAEQSPLKDGQSHPNPHDLQIHQLNVTKEIV